MYKKKVSCAVIGTGVGIHHCNTFENSKYASLSLICEKDTKKHPKLKKRFPNSVVTNNENLVFDNKKIKIVSICSHDKYHYPQIIKSIDNNKNIIVEKPLCSTYDQLIKIKKKISKKKNLLMTSNLVLRTTKIFNKIKQIIQNETVYYCEGDYLWSRPNKLLGWRKKDINYSIINGAAIHLIDLLIWILGSYPSYVTVYSNNSMVKKKSFNKKSFSLIVLEFKNKCICKITANTFSLTPHFHTLNIFSNKSSILHGTESSVLFKKNKKKYLLGYPDKRSRVLLIENFIKNVLFKKKPFNK